MTRTTCLAVFLICLGTAFDVFPATLMAQDTNAAQQVDVLDLESVDGEAKPGVSGESFDIETERLPDDGLGWLRDLDQQLADLRSAEYPQPDHPDLNGYNTLTLKALAMRLGDIKDPCEKAVYSKLYLDAHQDEFTGQTVLEIGKEMLLIDAIPNEWDAADFAIQKVFSTAGPWIAHASLAKNALAAIEVAHRYSKGTGAGWRGRWGLDIYDAATKNDWSADRILQERKSRQDDMATASEVVHALALQMRKDGLEMEKLFQAREAEIEAQLAEEIAEIDSALDEDLLVIQKDREEWQFELLQMGDRLTDIDRARFKWVRDDTPEERKRMELEFQARDQMAETRASRKRTAAKAKAEAIRAAELVSHEADIRVMAMTYNNQISDIMARIAQLQAEAQALKNFAEPVNAGECETLRKTLTMPREEAEALVIDRIKRLDQPRFDTLMANAGVTVPSDFYACLCANSGTPGVGGGMKYSEGKCWAIGVLGGASEVKIAGHGNAANWKLCLDKVTVTTPLHGAGTRMQDVLLDKLRDLPGRRIE